MTDYDESNTSTVATEDNTTTEERGDPRKISRMPEDQIDVGPYYPSGMSAPEAVLAGADLGLESDQVDAIRARLRGEEVAPAQQDEDEGGTE